MLMQSVLLFLLLDQILIVECCLHMLSIPTSPNLCENSCFAILNLQYLAFTDLICKCFNLKTLSIHRKQGMLVEFSDLALLIKYIILIHKADLQSRLAVIIVFAHVVRSSVHHFSKQYKFQAKTMFAAGETVCLAEWIIDDTCLVNFILPLQGKTNLYSPAATSDSSGFSERADSSTFSQQQQNNPIDRGLSGYPIPSQNPILSSTCPEEQDRR